MDVWSGNHPFYQGSGVSNQAQEGRVSAFNKRFAVSLPCRVSNQLTRRTVASLREAAGLLQRVTGLKVPVITNADHISVLLAAGTRGYIRQSGGKHWHNAQVRGQVQAKEGQGQEMSQAVGSLGISC